MRGDAPAVASGAPVGCDHLVDDPAEWLLTSEERGNPGTPLPAWTEGNLVRPLVHGSAYFDRLVEVVEHVGELVGHEQVVRVDVGEDGLLAQVVADQRRHVRVDGLVVGHAGAERVGQRDVAGAIGAEQPRRSQRRVDAERQRKLFAAGTPMTDALAALTRIWGNDNPVPTQFDSVAVRPNERTHARTSRSLAALVLEYGELGLYGVDSVKRVGSSSSRSP